MFRILGFVVGSIVSIAALVMLVGMPDFHLTGTESDEDRYGAAIQQLKEKRQSLVEAVEPAPVAELIEPLAPAAGDTPENTAAAAADRTVGEVATVSSEAPEHTRVAPIREPEVDKLTMADDLPDEPPLQYGNGDTPASTEWQAFWNPFRSEIAARGFVRRLEDVTGLDYRVAKVKNGVYQVAFSYDSDAERSRKLSQISAATGLDLSDSVP